MAEDLWTTINRYMYHEKKFSFSNSSSYEWFIFEWFMKVEFSREHVDDVIEDAVFTTGTGRNIEAIKEKDLIPADSYVNPATYSRRLNPEILLKKIQKPGNQSHHRDVITDPMLKLQRIELTRLLKHLTPKVVPEEENRS